MPTPSLHASASSVLLSRHERLHAALQEAGLDALVLNPGSSLTYLTGLHFHLMERPVVAIFTPDAPPTLVLPELEAGKLDALDFEVNAFPYSEDPATWPDAFQAAARQAGIAGRQVGVEPRGLRFLELRLLEAAAPGARFVSGEASLARLRMFKDPSEVDAMRRAAAVAERALEATLPAVREGITERELAAELTLQLLRAGSLSELPFAPIIAFGPHSANPHAVPSDRALRPGELVLIDWGANVEGYLSDLTRVFSLGEPDPLFAQIAEVVSRANRAALAQVRPGVPAGEVDRAARAVIEEAGFGPRFIHRTGHGLGLEDHEEPYIRSGNLLVLEPGMTFTIEPGIYLPDRGGVRIEDDVLVTEGGAESLSTLPHTLRVL